MRPLTTEGRRAALESREFRPTVKGYVQAPTLVCRSWPTLYPICDGVPGSFNCGPRFSPIYSLRFRALGEIESKKVHSLPRAEKVD